LESALLERLDFGGEEVVQELGVAGLGVLGVLERRGELVGRRAQAEVVQVLAQLLIDAVGHQDAASASSA
jgi:hypothetical protein